MNEHIVKQFDAELESIRTRVLQMGGLVEQQIVRAMEGLGNGDALLLEQVVNNDHRVNRLEVELDEACVHIIARRQPTAVDLRMIMTVVKTITDLERIGDEAKKIAKVARRLHGDDAGFAPHIELRHVADIAVGMLKKALDAFARIDLTASAQVVRQDKEVDSEFKGIMRQLITYMMEDPRTITAALETVWVAKAVERIGDHAKNVAEQVIYIVHGTDVRHTSFADIERIAKE